VLGGVLPPASFTRLSARNQLNENALIVDARQFTEFNQQHITRAFAVAFGDTFVTWPGWLPWGQPLLLLPSDPAQQDAMVRQFIHIGVDRINGFLAGASKLGNRLVYSQSPPTEST